jgi:hypothetical protein
MVENYQCADFYLERAADYEQKAERAVDLAARENFLEAAAKWRHSADIYQSIKSLSAAPPDRERRIGNNFCELSNSGRELRTACFWQALVKLARVRPHAGLKRTVGAARKQGRNARCSSIAAPARGSWCSTFRIGSH